MASINHRIGHGIEFGEPDLKAILEAAQVPNIGGADVAEIVLRAASAMPLTSSDFDRGMAAGLALARCLEYERQQ